MALLLCALFAPVAANGQSRTLKDAIRGMPLIGLLVGGIDFKEWKWVLSPAQMNADGSVAKAAVSVNYGVFLQTVLDFIIVALCIFIVIKAINKASEAIKKAKGIEAPKPAEPVTPEDTLLLREIRDSLKKSDK